MRAPGRRGEKAPGSLGRTPTPASAFSHIAPPVLPQNVVEGVYAKAKGGDNAAIFETAKAKFIAQLLWVPFLLQ